jgi:hypothetical protein
MTTYEVVFEHQSTRGPALRPGEEIDIAGERWEIVDVESTGAGSSRVRLVQHGTDGGDVDAHIRLPRPLRAPTSFESELVYTLNDLSTRLSTLAQVLNAYWGKDAA